MREEGRNWFDAEVDAPAIFALDEEEVCPTRLFVTNNRPSRTMEPEVVAER